jgi:VIT1/CCC1 family predicted Fe2+/Mn2+ transporter
MHLLSFISSSIHPIAPYPLVSDAAEYLIIGVGVWFCHMSAHIVGMLSWCS